MKIIQRSEAEALGFKRYFPGIPCKRGHVSEFYTSNSTCLECARLKKREAYRADIEKSRAKSREYVSRNSKRVYEKNARSRAKNRESVLVGKKIGYDRVKQSPEWQKMQAEIRKANRGRKREYDKVYAKKNSKKKVESARLWVKANPGRRRAIVAAYDGKRRAWTRDGDSATAIHAWAESVEKVCHWCSKLCADDYHMDHYRPLSKGGEHRVSNLVIACPTCNLRKNARDPEEFAASLKAI